MFMPVPDIFGVWAAGCGKSEFTENESVFRFDLNEAETKASYSLCLEPCAQRASLVGLRRWISSVFDYEGFAPANTKQIKTTKPGIAEKQSDGTFKIITKGMIEFIS